MTQAGLDEGLITRLREKYAHMSKSATASAPEQDVNTVSAFLNLPIHHSHGDMASTGRCAKEVCNGAGINCCHCG